MSRYIPEYGSHSVLLSALSTGMYVVRVYNGDQNENIKNLLHQQSEIILSIKELANSAKDAVSPNPELLNAMKITSQSLKDFNSSLEELKRTVKLIRKEEIEFSVKKEVEKLLLANLSKDNENQKA